MKYVFEQPNWSYYFQTEKKTTLHDLTMIEQIVKLLYFMKVNDEN